MNLGISLSLGSTRAGSGGGGAPAPLDFIGYGQSNWLFHVTNTTSQPAANADTLMWDFTTNQWVTPTGNGLRNFLNAMQAATGRVCRMVYGGQGGVAIAALSKGSTNYNNLLARISASGANPTHIIYHQGEGDGNTVGTTLSSYQTALDTLHADLASDLGKTRAQLPLVCSSLATVTDPSFSGAPDSLWSTIQTALATINSVNANMHYSHSNMDATLVDQVHWDGPSYGRSGARYARTVQVLMGLQTTVPKLFLTAAERLTNTTTRVDLVHSMGTDFTPSTGITGFEVSNDNGTNWAAASAARLDADSITLTHSDLGTVERLVRYQFGKTPNVSAPARDNSSLTNLLNFTTTNLVAAGAALLPTITYAASLAATRPVNTQQAMGTVSVPGSSESLLALIGHTMFAGFQGGLTYPATMDVTAQPSGTVITATRVRAVSPDTATGVPSAAIYQAVLPSGTTSITGLIQLPINPFSTGRFHVSTIPVARLSSTTATGSAAQRTATSLSSTTSALATSAGGVVFALGIVDVTTVGNVGTLSGSETYATRNSAIAAGSTHVVGDASGVAASAGSTVTVTYNNSGNVTVVAASWR